MGFQGTTETTENLPITVPKCYNLFRFATICESSDVPQVVV
jgi:hypothetical protein